jgi:hypothetical protein
MESIQYRACLFGASLLLSLPHRYNHFHSVVVVLSHSTLFLISKLLTSFDILCKFRSNVRPWQCNVSNAKIRNVLRILRKNRITPHLTKCQSTRDICKTKRDLVPVEPPSLINLLRVQIQWVSCFIPVSSTSVDRSIFSSLCFQIAGLIPTDPISSSAGNFGSIPFGIRLLEFFYMVVW